MAAFMVRFIQPYRACEYDQGNRERGGQAECQPAITAEEHDPGSYREGSQCLTSQDGSDRAKQRSSYAS